MLRLEARLAAAVTPIAETFRNPGLRKLQLAWVGSIFGSWSYAVALAVYAFEQGGASAVGIVFVIRMLPAAVVSPFLATLADRMPRRIVMVGSDVTCAGLMAAAAVVIGLHGSAWLVYAIAGTSTAAGTAFRPAQAALLPALARNPAELTAANVASSTLEGVGAFVGPAIGGLLLAATSPEVVFAVNAASFIWSAALITAIRVVDPVAERRQREVAPDEAGAAAGFRLAARNHDLATLLGLFMAQTLVDGARGVLVVVAAFTLLDGSASTVGWLNAAIGVGGLLGGAVALLLAARMRLADDLGIGLFLYGVPLLAIAAAPNLPVALAALAVHGIGNSVLDVSGITLLQRTVPDALLGRVLGILEGIILGSIGIGALVAPVLVHHVGTRETLLAAGALLLALTLLALPRLRRLDASAAPPAAIYLLKGVDILAPLPLPSLERLARSLTEVRVPAGATVIAEGEPGDRFYIVEDGVVRIEGKDFGPGSSFGEIALLRNVPRTATVTALTDVILQALERDEFLAAVTGNEPSSAVADAVVARRLGERTS